MKNLVVALMLLSLSVVSCGKNNATNTGTAAVSNPITNTAVQGASLLGSIIDNYTIYFGSAQANVNMTYGQLASTGAPLLYHYTKSTATNSNSCTLKWGIFYVCSYATSSSSATLTESRIPVNNNAVNVVDKQNELRAYINNAYMISQSSSTAYLLTLRDGRKVIIDTAIPLQGQPSAIQDASGTSEYLYKITQ